MMALLAKSVSDVELGKLISGKEEAICATVAQPFDDLVGKSLEGMVEIQQVPNPHYGEQQRSDGVQDVHLLRRGEVVDMRSDSPKRCLTAERPSVAVAKRNARERTRVHTVNQAFLVLKFHLPALRANSKRVSKLKILRAAINYIYSLADWLKSPNNKAPSSSDVNLKSFKLSAPINQSSLVTQQPQPTVPKFSFCDSLSAASYISGLVSPPANPYMLDPFYYSSAYVPNGAAAAAGLYNPTVYP